MSFYPKFFAALIALALLPQAVIGAALPGEDGAPAILSSETAEQPLPVKLKPAGPVFLRPERAGNAPFVQAAEESRANSAVFERYKTLYEKGLPLKGVRLSGWHVGDAACAENGRILRSAALLVVENPPWGSWTAHFVTAAPAGCFSPLTDELRELVSDFIGGAMSCESAGPSRNGAFTMSGEFGPNKRSLEARKADGGLAVRVVDDGIREFYAFFPIK